VSGNLSHEDIRSHLLEISEEVDKALEEHMADEQLGSIVQVLTYEQQTSGKKLRPALATIMSQCLSGDFRETVDIASACELLHSASLMLDDTIDRDDTRRGKVAVHKAFGGGLALMGTYVLALMGLKIGITKSNRIGQLLVKTLEQLVVGGSQEIYWESWEYQDYYKIMANKTAALFAASCEIGSICGKSKGRGGSYVKAARRYGKSLGMLYQHCDDYVDIAKSINLGDPIGDIKNRNTTTAIIHCYLHTKKPEIKTLLDLYRKRVDLPDYALRLIIAELEELNSLAYVKNIIYNLSAEASQIASTFPDNDHRKYLISMPQFMIDVQMEEIEMPNLLD